MPVPLAVPGFASVRILLVLLGLVVLPLQVPAKSDTGTGVGAGGTNTTTGTTTTGASGTWSIRAFLPVLLVSVLVRLPLALPVGPLYYASGQ